MPKLRLAGVIRESIVDGPGFRFVVFAQGCPHHCEGCHNPETHSFDGGYMLSENNISKNDIDYVVDQTNFDNDKTRNYLRNEIFPLLKKVNSRVTENICRFGKNILGDQQVLDEIHKIFDITGGTEMFNTIEHYSEEAARMMGMDSHSEEYMNHLLTANNGNHNGH